MGLLDYYRQFEGLSEDEVNRGLREEAAERRRKALTRVETIDLSQTTWPDLPHPNIIDAITFVARRGLHRYPHVRHGSELRSALAEYHGVDAGRLIIGNGAAQLLSSATRALIEPGQDLITSWPSYPLFPIMARRAHGRAVPVSGGVDALLEAVASNNTRVVALASPNDPTGELLGTAELERLLAGLPEGVALLLDESLVEFVDAQPVDASLALLERYPQLLVFRSFSKARGLAGLRIGYAIGGPGSDAVLSELEPDLGVNELSEAGALTALRTGSVLLALHVRTVAIERSRLIGSLRKRGFEVTDSQANFLWVAHRDFDGNELATHLKRGGVLVAPGDALGEPRHVRISVRDSKASDRLLGAVDGALESLSPTPLEPDPTAAENPRETKPKPGPAAAEHQGGAEAGPGEVLPAESQPAEAD
jgi:histidinol-phosphate aminotransferase